MAQSNKLRSLAYSKEKAVGYEEKRARQAAWHRENAIIERWSATVRAGSTVLDIPCGTGRLLPILFKRGVRVVGVDLSQEMMDQIPESLRSSALLEGLERHSAAALPYPDNHFDYVVSLRLFHLDTVLEGDQVRVLTIPKGEQVRMLREFMRVADKEVLLHVPLSDRSWITRAADNFWRALPWHEGPAYVGLRILHGVRKRWGQVSQQRKHGSGRRHSRRRPGPVWSLREIKKAFADGGFEVTKAYGAISPISAKKIIVATRTAPAQRRE